MFYVWLYCVVMLQVIVGGICAIAELSFMQASTVSLVSAVIGAVVLYYVSRNKLS